MKIKKINIFLIIISLSVTFTFSPILFFYKDISFDKVKFINEWLSMWGRGIIIALLFYSIMEIIKFYDKIYYDEKSLDKIIEYFDKIKNSEISNPYDPNHPVFLLEYIFIIIKSLKNEGLRAKIYLEIKSKESLIRENLCSNNKDENLIDNINILIKKIYEFKNINLKDVNL